MANHVRAFLADNPPAALTEQFGIKEKRHPAFPELMHLVYCQIASSPFVGHPIVNECRGLILDARTLEVVSHPFHRFYNDGEACATPIHWPSARVQDKLDGSLTVLYHYAGQWHVATKGSPDAGGPVGGHTMTFRDLFWRTWGHQRLGLPDLDPDLTYMFELTSPLNRVVVAHDDHRLTLLGARSRVTGQEFPASAFPDLNPVREYPLGDLEAVRAAAEALNPIAGEGFVVVDRDYNRVKIKSPRYVAIHHLKDTLTTRGLLEMVKAGEEHEVLTYFPELRAAYEETAARFAALVAELEADYARLAHIDAQKDFALEAVKTRWSGALFTVRKGQAASIREALCKVPADKLESLIA